ILLYVSLAIGGDMRTKIRSVVDIAAATTTTATKAAPTGGKGARTYSKIALSISSTVTVTAAYKPPNITNRKQKALMTYVMIIFRMSCGFFKANTLLNSCGWFEKAN